MKKLFNATCSRCGKFKPRCAKVFLGAAPIMTATKFQSQPDTLCADCRKDCRGRFKLAEEHR